MSRSGYSHECEDQWALIRWRGAVKAALKGGRGQAFLRETAAALDALPVKELAANTFQADDGAFCTLGAVGAARGMDITALDPDDIATVAAKFGISDAMAREIVFMNDEAGRYNETPAKRWDRMRAWVRQWAEK